MRVSYWTSNDINKYRVSNGKIILFHYQTLNLNNFRSMIDTSKVKAYLNNPSLDNSKNIFSFTT